MHKKIILLLLLVTTYTCYAGSGITPAKAITVAETYYRSTTSYSTAIGKIYQTDKDDNGNIIYYIVDMDNSGFVIVSGTTVTNPIVAISTHGNYKAIPKSGVEDYLYNLHNHISNLYKLNMAPQEKATSEWNQLGNGLPLITSRSAASISPLLTTTWNQSPYYNEYCPGGSVTGCVATAMAQIIKYWNYPATGKGSYSYSDSPYGTLSANFDSTFNWSIMPASVSSSTATTETNAVAGLMYKLGVSVAMEYSPGGSGASVLQSEDPGGPCAQYSYVNYFGYNASTIQGLVQSSYTTSAWDSIINIELNNSRPIEYVGFGTDGGHTWVLDGYNSSGLYDMNWGWGGLDDGYFALNSLDPSGIPLGSDNAMLIGIEPPTTQPTCGEPTAVTTSSITTTSAVVSWTGTGSAKSYNLNYQVSGANSWTSVTGITSASYSLTGLTAGTTYNVQVQQVCTGESSGFTGTVSFTTTEPPCGEPTAVAVSSIATTSAVVSWTGTGSAKSYNLNYQVSGANSWTSVTGITSASYSLTGLTAGTTYNVQVQQVCTGESSSFTGTVSFTTTEPPCGEPTAVAVSSIATTSAVVSWTGTGSAKSYNLNYQALGASSWTSVTGITSASYSLTGLTAGTTYNVQVQQVCTGESSGFTGTVSFTTTEPACGEPTAVAVSSIATTSAVVSWVGTGSAKSYNLNYQASGASSWTSVTGITSASYSLSGLTAGTTYNVQVQQVCTGESSSFTGTVSFTTTEPPCGEPTAVKVSSITTTSAVVSWVGTGSAKSYNLNYQASGASSWTSVTGITSANYSLSGLTAGTTYNVQVQQVCTGESSGFTGTVSFTTTEPACGEPTAVAVSSIATTSAVVSWVGTGSAKSYNLNYQASGASSWTSVTGITSANYSLSGLTAGTTYNVQVQQVCTGESSGFTGTVSFTTTEPPCGEPTAVAVSSIATTSAVVSWTGTGSAKSYTLSYQASGASSWALVTGITSASYSLSGLTAGTTYNVQVQQVCTGESSNFTNTVSFTTTEPPCGEPTAVAVSSIATTSAVVSWVGTGSAKSYTLSYQASGASSWALVTGITSASYSLSGLTAGTTYNVQVQQVCTGESSGFTGTVSFTTTEPPCGEPTAVKVSSITTTSAVVSWVGTGSAKSYNLNYQASGASSWALVTGITSASYSLSGLTAGTTYNVQVQQVCTGESSSFTNTVSFTTTQPVCGEPTAVKVSSITTTSAVVSWVGTGSAKSYNLNYQASGASSWTSVAGITSESYSLTDLSEGTAYNVQVQQECTTGESSSFTGTVTFNTTSYCTSSGTTTSEYIKSVQFGSIDNINSNADGDYQNYTNLSTNITAGSSYKMTVTPGFTGTSYTEYWSVYIDFNHTGDFVLARKGKGAGSLSGSITIPATALIGSTRMRVIMHRGSYITGACGSFSDGDVHDYTVVISHSATITLQPNDADSISTPAAVSGGISINVFPNPTSTLLNISYLTTIDVSDITLVDATGKILLKSPAKLNTLDFSNYSPGWYILIVTGSDGSVSKKLVMVAR